MHFIPEPCSFAEKEVGISFQRPIGFSVGGCSGVLDRAGWNHGVYGSIVSIPYLVRSRPVQNIALKEYAYNGSLTIVKGHRFFEEGRICFPATIIEHRDQSYRTIFGPSVSHDGVVNCKCNHCLSVSLTRLTCTRKPENPGYDQALKENQDRFISSKSNFIAKMCHRYMPHLSTFTTMEQELDEHYDDPHSKKGLRIQGKNDLDESGDRYSDVWSRTQHVLLKQKTDEVLPRDKLTRSIGDLGVEASLQGFRLMKMYKLAQEHEPFYLNGGLIEFCPSPSVATLSAVFDKLLNPPGRFYFVYFSDDSCLSLRVKSKVHLFNLDISKCDASHSPAIFQALLDTTTGEPRKAMQCLVDQCCLPVTIKGTGKGEKIVARFKEIKLFSGSTITTSINNLANILIALSISECTFTEEHIAGRLTAAGERVGYILKGTTPLKHLHELQFLKHSPCFDCNGILTPMLNLGVFLRLSGSCRGDLPGSKKIPIEERARLFQGSLIQSTYPYTHFPMLENMRHNFSSSDTKTSSLLRRSFKYKIDYSVRKSSYFSDEEVGKRYNLSDIELDELRIFFSSGLWDHTDLSVTRKILNMDYGLW